tara:strand:- start:2181 stop:3194 length:1014 start_codon:yes stop_codon:yes gene_type:complete
MDWKKQVFRLQVDVTSHCNSKCGGCSRNISGGETQPWLKLSHLDKELWYRLCTEDTINSDIIQLKLNGNWGDAGMHPHLPEMISVFGKCNPETSVNICTNGGTHNEKWWSSLGNALFRNTWHHAVDFAIDGLEDTHSIYRRSTDYNKILANAVAFAKENGNSRWIMTLFDHNIHQIDEAIEEARKNKFTSISFRHSQLKNGLVETPTEEYRLHTDKADKVLLPETVYFSNSDKDRAFHDKFMAHRVESKCPWYRDGTVQIDPWGRVWPCCHIADAMEGVDVPDQREQLLEEFPEEDWNNLAKHSMNDILSHEWFNSTLNSAVEHGKYDVCKSNCGVE